MKRFTPLQRSTHPGYNATRMINGYDIAWGALLSIGAPYWLLHPRARRKVLRALRERMARRLPEGVRSSMRHPVTARMPT